MGMARELLITLLGFSVLMNISNCQRIWDSGSDWFLRFRSERDLDRPETVRYWVRSEMDMDGRTASTNISRTVFNSANTTQEYVLKIILPKTSLLTNISIDGYAVEFLPAKNETLPGDGGLEYLEFGEAEMSARLHRNGRSFGNDWDTEAEQGIHHDPHEHHRYRDDAEEGEEQVQIEQVHNGHHLYNQDHLDPEDLDKFMLFALPVSMGPRQNVTMSVIYVEELEMNETRLTMDMFLCPEEILHNFSVQVDIKCEEDTILETIVSASVLGDINNETLEEISENRQLVNFTMNTREQAHYFGSSGFYGTLNLQVETVNTETSEYEIAPLDLSFLSPGSSLSLTQITSDYNRTTLVAYEDLFLEDWNTGLYN